MKMFQHVPTVYLYRHFVDFRKSINGLVAVAEQQMQMDTLDNKVFVFCNKGRDKLKILYWDKTGFALWYKCLTRDKFKWPTQLDGEPFILSEQQLHWLLSGFDILGHQTRQPQSYT